MFNVLKAGSALRIFEQKKNSFMKTLVAAKIKFKQINKLQKIIQKKTTKEEKNPKEKRIKEKVLLKNKKKGFVCKTFLN